MKICVVGWYGTETVGDRAILDGILQIYGRINSSTICSIGSLYPFFTERTLLLDGEIYQANAEECTIKCFDVKQKAILKKEISESDCVIMGGGPLMDLLELKVVEYAFEYAKKIGKQTVVFGCGLGPLKKDYYQKTVGKILAHSDLVIYRDQQSEDLSRKLYGNQFNVRTHSICDPAVFSILKYKNQNIFSHNSDVSINFRNVTSEYSEQHHMDLFEKIINWASENFDRVKLVPMHTFSIGGDDREVFAELLYQKNYGNVDSCNYPLSLYDTYKEFANSFACIGMRYHSVLMQTLLNGNNLILDYTEKKTGKISGFLAQLDNQNFYSSNRLINIVKNDEKDMEPFLCELKKANYFSCDLENAYTKYMNQYLSLLQGRRA